MSCERQRCVYVCVWSHSTFPPSLNDRHSESNSKSAAVHLWRVSGDSLSYCLPQQLITFWKRSSGLMTQLLPGRRQETAVSMHADGRPSLFSVEQVEEACSQRALEDEWITAEKGPAFSLFWDQLDDRRAGVTFVYTSVQILFSWCVTSTSLSLAKNGFSTIHTCLVPCDNRCDHVSTPRPLTIERIDLSFVVFPSVVVRQNYG